MSNPQDVTAQHPILELLKYWLSKQRFDPVKNAQIPSQTWAEAMKMLIIGVWNPATPAYHWPARWIFPYQLSDEEALELVKDRLRIHSWLYPHGFESLLHPHVRARTSDSLLR